MMLWLRALVLVVVPALVALGVGLGFSAIGAAGWSAGFAAGCWHFASHDIVRRWWDRRWP